MTNTRNASLIRKSVGWFAAMTVVALSLVLSQSAEASDSSSGCGVGWMVTQRQSLLSSLIRSSTNATFLNTVAMTFGTSGCARHDIVKNDKKEIHYAEANYDQLQIEMAQGSGEYLHGLAAVMGCDAGSFAQFSDMARQNYSQIFTSESQNEAPQVMLSNVKAGILMDAALAQKCRVVI